MNFLLVAYLVGMVGYLLYAGYVQAKQKATITSYPLMFVSIALWPMFIIMAIGTVIAKRT